MQQKKLLLIDAYAMIYRAYYAFIRVPRINSKGENTSAVFGFITTLEDLIKKLSPTHMAVAFDPHGPTFRHEQYAAYKAQRPETPEDIRKAVPILHDVLQAMNIPALEVDGFEADDVIGTIAHQAEQAGFDVYMATPDKDYGQLVTEHVFQYRPRHTGGFELMGPQQVCDKYGISSTNQVIDLLGLMGDASDNIPGCRGVGEKTAVDLINKFGSIEQLLDSTQQLKGSLLEKISSQTDQILFSKFLATIRTDVPIAFEESGLVIKERDWNKLSELYTELEFYSLLKGKSSSTSSKSKPQPKGTPQAVNDGQLDLFAEPSSTPEVTAAQYDTIENRLCAYLLNPEVPFNPNREPDWEALRADNGLWNLYKDVELPLVPVLREMEQAGVRIDADMLHQAELSLGQELSDIEKRIIQQAGIGFNINSPSQVGEVLYDHLHLDSKAKRGRNGKYSTSEDVLTALRDKHPIVGLILEQRELKKLISTYILSLPSYINPETGKIHTTYHQTVTATGRLSSSNPNLQNLPIRSERGQLIRKAVIADEGCQFVSADYSQIELRLLAHLSGDEQLIRAFLDGQDIHAATAATIFHKSIAEVTKEERRRAKTANFGIIYGISTFGLSQQLGCSRAEAKELIDGYFASFPQVIAYIERQRQFAREHGYVETLFGRKRYLPDILSQNSVVRSFAERNAVNAPIQGTAADIMKMAMIGISQSLHSKGLKSQMVMQIHDELNFNVPSSEVDVLRELVVHQMQDVVHLSVPLIAACGVGTNWLQAH